MIIDKTNPNLKYEIYSKYKEILNEMNNDIKLIINQLDKLYKILTEYIEKAKYLQNELENKIKDYLHCINGFFENSIDILNPKGHKKLLDNITNKLNPFNLNILNVYENQYINEMKKLNEKLSDIVKNWEHFEVFDPPNINSLESDPNFSTNNQNSISEFVNKLNHINSVDNSYLNYYDNNGIKIEEEEIDINTIKLICQVVIIMKQKDFVKNAINYFVIIVMI